MHSFSIKSVNNMVENLLSTSNGFFKHSAGGYYSNRNEGVFYTIVGEQNIFIFKDGNLVRHIEPLSCKSAIEAMAQAKKIYKIIFEIAAS